MYNYLNSEKCDTDAKFERAERMYFAHLNDLVSAENELESLFQKYVFILKQPYTIKVKLINP